MTNTTILIAARNAAATIGRAIRSAKAQGNCPIVLVDDFSDDGTADIAYEVAGDALTIVRPARHYTLGLTRQTGLLAVRTKYTMLLDADDELLPDRVMHMENALERSTHELYADTIALHDGLSGRFIRRLTIPGFISSKPCAIRLFERNYLPGIGQIGFLTDLAQRTGYDAALNGPEDTDLVLRMTLAGGRFEFDGHCGYRMYAYPGSVSRDLRNQRQMYSRCLKKFSYTTIRTAYHEQGYDERTTLWALVSMAIFREEHAMALDFLECIKELPLTDPLAIIDPDGPCPAPEAWRIAFQHGTLLLLLNRDEEAAKDLDTALNIDPTPETQNNLAVACERLGNSDRAKLLISQALAQFPDFLDARLNLQDTVSHVTTHALRRQPSRSEYQNHSV